MSIYPKRAKAIAKAISLKPEQLERLGQFIDLTNYGEFSRFAQEALDEKMDRLDQQADLELKAS